MQTQTEKIVAYYSRIELKRQGEVARAKEQMARANYDKTRTAAQKARDQRRLEKLVQALGAASERRQQAEALMLARAQSEQGVGLIEAALARKTKESEA